MTMKHFVVFWCCNTNGNIEESIKKILTDNDKNFKNKCIEIIDRGAKNFIFLKTEDLNISEIDLSLQMQAFTNKFKSHTFEIYVKEIKSITPVHPFNDMLWLDVNI